MLDYRTIRPMAAHLSAQLHAGRTHIILDMGDVESLSAGALGALLLQQTAAEQLGATIKIASMSALVYQTFKDNGFAEVFQTYDTPGEALDSFDPGVRVA